MSDWRGKRGVTSWQFSLISGNFRCYVEVTFWGNVSADHSTARKIIINCIYAPYRAYWDRMFESWWLLASSSNMITYWLSVYFVAEYSVYRPSKICVGVIQSRSPDALPSEMQAMEMRHNRSFISAAQCLNRSKQSHLITELLVQIFLATSPEVNQSLGLFLSEWRSHRSTKKLLLGLRQIIPKYFRETENRKHSHPLNYGQLYKSLYSHMKHEPRWD